MLSSILTFRFVSCANLLSASHLISGRLDAQLSSDDAVKRVLAGEKGDARGQAVRTSKSHELDNKHAKEEGSKSRKEKEVICVLCEAAGESFCDSVNHAFVFLGEKELRSERAKYKQR